jgi:hypothetical protein
MSLSTHKTTFLFPADFPNAPLGVNEETLIVAIQVAAGVGQPFNIQKLTNGNVIVEYAFAPSSGTLTAVAAACTAHTGAATSALLQSFASANEDTNATTTMQAKRNAGLVDELFTSTALSAGRWAFTFAAQLRTTTLVANSGVRAMMRAALANPAPTLSGSDDRAYTDHSIFSATQPQLWTFNDTFTVVAGQIFRFQPRFARNGSAVTAAMSNFRADLYKIG